MGLEVVDRPYAGDAEPAGFAEETSDPQQLLAGVTARDDEMTRSGSTIAPDGFRPVKVHGVDLPAVRPQPGHTDLDRVGGCNPAACQGLVQQPEVADGRAPTCGNRRRRAGADSARCGANLRQVLPATFGPRALIPSGECSTESDETLQTARHPRMPFTCRDWVTDQTSCGKPCELTAAEGPGQVTLVRPGYLLGGITIA